MRVGGGGCHYSNPLPPSEPKRSAASKNRLSSNGLKLPVSEVVLNSSSSVTGFFSIELKNSGSSVTDAEKTPSVRPSRDPVDWVAFPCLGDRNRGPKVAIFQSVIKGEGCYVALKLELINTDEE